jgi:excisionase family DNA binding protein
MTGTIRFEPMLTVSEVAELLHIHTNTVRRWADKCYLNAYRVNYRGDRRFKRAEILMIMTGLKEHQGNEKEAVLALK